MIYKRSFSKTEAVNDNLYQVLSESYNEKEQTLENVTVTNEALVDGSESGVYETVDEDKKTKAEAVVNSGIYDNVEGNGKAGSRGTSEIYAIVDRCA